MSNGSRGRTPSKSRRSPLVHVVREPSPGDAGRSAPNHLGVVLGFAPTHQRERRSPGTVRLSRPIDDRSGGTT